MSPCGRRGPLAALGVAGWEDRSSAGLGLGGELAGHGPRAGAPRCHLLSPCALGLAAWEEYPTLKMLMEMVMTK